MSLTSPQPTKMTHFPLESGMLCRPSHLGDDHAAASIRNYISKENAHRQRRGGFGFSNGSNFGFIIRYDILSLIASTPFSPSYSR